MRGYRFAPWVWTQGLALAFFSGYLRIAADRHYLTDVVTGALFGAAAGALVPLLHRPLHAGAARFVIGPVAGPGLGVAGVF
jgi:membrane-associated phospholipid phosphatase